MSETKLRRTTMNDSLIIPALTIRIPMPQGAGIPARSSAENRLTSIAACAESSETINEE
jgi:hypothetical protein